VSKPEPWRCPACLTWIAPHVPEHRCDPPGSGVTVIYPGTTGPASSAGISISTATLPGTVTVNVSGAGVTSAADLAGAVASQMLRRANSNWHSALPGRAA
jgi:S1-C subfamily serine protease